MTTTLLHSSAAEPDTTPNNVEMTTKGPEVVPWKIDATGAVLESGGSAAASPSSSMVDRTTGLAVTLSDSPTASGSVITQTVRSAELIAGHTFDVYVNYTVTGAASATELTAHFTIDCTS